MLAGLLGDEQQAGDDESRENRRGVKAAQCEPAYLVDDQKHPGALNGEAAGQLLDVIRT